MRFRINIRFKLIFVTLALVSAALGITYYRTSDIIRTNFLRFLEDKIRVSDQLNDNYLGKIQSFKLQSTKAFGELADLQQALRDGDTLRIPYYMIRNWKDYDLDGFELYTKAGALLGEAGQPFPKIAPETVAAWLKEENFAGLMEDDQGLVLVSATALLEGQNLMVGKTRVDDRMALEFSQALNIDIALLHKGIPVGTSGYFKTQGTIILQNNLVEKAVAGETTIDNQQALGQLLLYRPLKTATQSIIGALVIVLPTEVILATEQESRDSILELLAWAGLATLVVTLLFAQSIASPIRRLTRWAGLIQKGDYQHSERIKTLDEISDLGKVFGSMTRTIHEYNTKLEQLVAQRTEELNAANQSLTQINAKNHKDLLLAQKIQLTLVPKVFPTSDKISFAGFYRPMDELGGDLYDVFVLGPKKFGLLMLDVCGHGVPAALITTMAKVSFKTNAERFSDTGSTVSQVNKEIATVLQGSGDYFTVFYGIVDLEAGKMTYTNGGHPKVYVQKPGGKIVGLEQNSIFVGVMPDIPYATSETPVGPGDRILLYTDGLLEARNTAGEVYDIQRFEKALKDSASLPYDVAVQALIDKVVHFAEGRNFDDDLTVLMAELKA